MSAAISRRFVASQVRRLLRRFRHHQPKISLGLDLNYNTQTLNLVPMATTTSDWGENSQNKPGLREHFAKLSHENRTVVAPLQVPPARDLPRARLEQFVFCAVMVEEETWI